MFNHYAAAARGLSDYSLAQVGGENLITSFTYDAYGRVTQKIMPKGNASRTIDSSGSLQGTGDATYATTYSYYAATTAASPPATCSGGSSVDQDGALKTLAPHGVAATTYVYDAAGRTVAKTNGRGTTCFTFDAGGLGEVVSEKAPGDAQSTTFSYDGIGNILSATNAAGTETRTYDEAGRMASETDATGASEVFGYDEDGNRLSRVATPISGGSTYATQYHYDLGDELVSESDPAGQSYEFFYDSRGSLRAANYPNDTFSWVDVNPLGEVTDVFNRHGSISAATTDPPIDMSPIADYSYTYNADAQRLRQAVAASGEPGGTTAYAYDAIGRLSQVAFPSGVCRNYQYDLDSNRSAILESPAGCGGTFSPTATYGYSPGATPGVDELSSVTVGGTTTEYSYTSSGEVSSYGLNNVVKWDGWGRTLGGTFRGMSVSYAYGPLGDVVSRTSGGGGETDFQLDGLFQLRGGSVTSESVDGPAGDLAQYTYGSSTMVAALYYDAHGDAVATADSNGSTTSFQAYDPFGNPTGEQPSDSLVHAFVGRWEKLQDTSSGVVLMGARPYDPTLGRFLSVDPVDGGSLNNYDYANQDPLNLYDLTGTDIPWDPHSYGAHAGGECQHLDGSDLRTCASQRWPWFAYCFYWPGDPECVAIMNYHEDYWLSVKAACGVRTVSRGAANYVAARSALAKAWALKVPVLDDACLVVSGVTLFQLLTGS